MIFKTFGWPFAITALALLGALALGGPSALVLVGILVVLEVSLSFDNAVVNATILVKMTPVWQKLFLTVGILIAVFGMRLLFPLVIVGVTAHLSPSEAVRLALEGGSIDQPGTYAYLLHEAHPSIAAFGSMFLGMLFLDFIFEDREIAWLTWLERPLASIGKLDQLSVAVALAGLTVCAETLAEQPEDVLIAGVCGIITYLLVNSVADLLEVGEAPDEPGCELPGIHGGADQVLEVVGDLARNQPAQAVKVAGRAGLALFLYLELIDAAFSFDGVIGAFAITQNIFVIAVGLGVGAIYIRSLTVYLVRQGTLDDYVYLEHGAHWAIGALAVLLLVSVGHEVPEVITGLIGVAFIAAALVSSFRRNRRQFEERAALAAGIDPEAPDEREDATVGN